MLMGTTFSHLLSFPGDGVVLCVPVNIQVRDSELCTPYVARDSNQPGHTDDSRINHAAQSLCSGL